MAERSGAKWAVVVAAVLLVIGFGGVSFAGGMITGANIQNNTVTSADIKNGSLQTNDLSSGAVDNLAKAATPVVYRATDAGPVVLAGDAWSTVVALSLPSGSFNGQLTATATNTGTSAVVVPCTIGLGEAPGDEIEVSVAAGQSTTIATQTLFAPSNDSSQAVFQCGGSNVTIDNAVITATSIFPGG